MHSLLCSAIFFTIASLSAAYDGNLMLTMVNKERSDRGLKPLRLSQTLNKVAQIQSDDQAKRKRMGHDGSDGSWPWDRCKRSGYPTQRCGENVAWNYKDETAVMKGWMNSQGHRENILNTDYLEFGSALALDTAKSPYHTQVFGNPNPWGNGDNKQSPSPAPAPTPTPAPAPRPSPAPAPRPSPSPSPSPAPSPKPRDRSDRYTKKPKDHSSKDIKKKSKLRKVCYLEDENGKRYPLDSTKKKRY